MPEKKLNELPKPSAATANMTKMYEAWLKDGKAGIENRLHELEHEKEEKTRLEEREDNSEREG